MRLIAAALLSVWLSVLPAAASAAGGAASGRGAGPECAGHGGGELL